MTDFQRPEHPNSGGLPLEAYDAEMLNVLIAGSKRTITYVPDSTTRETKSADVKRFRRFRQQLHSLRAKMRDAHDPRVNELYKCQIRIDASTGIMTLSPRNTGFSDLISQATEGDATAGIAPTKTPTLDENFLDSIEESPTVESET